MVTVFVISTLSGIEFTIIATVIMNFTHTEKAKWKKQLTDDILYSSISDYTYC